METDGNSSELRGGTGGKRSRRSTDSERSGSWRVQLDTVVPMDHPDAMGMVFSLWSPSTGDEILKRWPSMNHVRWLHEEPMALSLGVRTVRTRTTRTSHCVRWKLRVSFNLVRLTWRAALRQLEVHPAQPENNGYSWTKPSSSSSSIYTVSFLVRDFKALSQAVWVTPKHKTQMSFYCTQFGSLQARQLRCSKMDQGAQRECKWSLCS